MAEISQQFCIVIHLLIKIATSLVSQIHLSRVEPTYWSSHFLEPVYSPLP